MTQTTDRKQLSMDEEIAVMREQARRLLQLLDDPHPGLFTWCEFVGKRLRDLAAHLPSRPRKDD